MSKDNDYDDLYEDDVDGLLDLESPVAEVEEDDGDAFSREMFGPTGRGSPAMGRQSPYDLSRNANKSLRSVGLDETHLKDTTLWDTKLKEPQLQPQPKPKAVVRAAVRSPMVKAKPPQPPIKNYQINDEKAEEEADKLWRRLGHDPLRYHLPGGQFMYKLPNGMWAPIPPKGGTRKRSTRKNKRSNKNKRMKSRKSKRSNRKSKRSRR